MTAELKQDLVKLANALSKEGHRTEARAVRVMLAGIAEVDMDAVRDMGNLDRQITSYKGLVKELGWGHMAHPERWNELASISKGLAEFFQGVHDRAEEGFSKSQTRNKEMDQRK